MKAEIVRIGNSRGIRLPKAILEQCGLEGTVELEVSENCLLIRPAKQVRAGWSKAFGKMHRQNDDDLIDQADAIANKFDEDEWQW